MEVWSAPSCPGTIGGTSITDRRANSFANIVKPFSPISSAAGSVTADATDDMEEGSVWWWNILSTDVPASHAIVPSDLWPKPAAGSTFVVAAFGNDCVNGAVASTCVRPFSDHDSLTVGSGAVLKPGSRQWELYSAAPVLSGGWVLIGEESKYVRVSAQRILTAVASPRAFTDDAIRPEAELNANPSGFEFTVIGAAQEETEITVIVPGAYVSATPSPSSSLDDDNDLQLALKGTILKFKVRVAAPGYARVTCSFAVGCIQK
jgi:hypothetical protein